MKFTLVPDEDAEFAEVNLDLAVRLVDGPGDLEGVELTPARKVTVAAPDAPEVWIDWGAKLPEGAQAQVTVAKPGEALSGAVAGMGRAVLPELLAARDIAAGRLQVLDGPHDGTRAYWLVAPTPQWRTKKVRALVAFLTDA